MVLLLLLNTLKDRVVEPSVAKTVSKVSVSVLNVSVSKPKLSFLQLLLINNNTGKISRKSSLMDVFTRLNVRITNAG